MICNILCLEKMKELFRKFHPKILKFTVESMTENKLKFLDILFIKINDKLEHIMQIKPLKTEFFVPFRSYHSMHIKINIIENMAYRASILCSNYILFYHTINALRIRFEKSGYPLIFINKYLNDNIYKYGTKKLNDIKHKRENKIKILTNKNKIEYESIYKKINKNKNINKKYITLPYDNSIIKQTTRKLKKMFPEKVIVYKLNESVQKTIRRKDANNKLL